MVLDLEPQPSDVGIDEAAVAEVLVAPHPLQQLIARQHGPSVLGELAHQPELGLGQAQLDIVLQHDTLLVTNLDVAELRGSSAGSGYLVELDTTELSPDPRCQFFGNDGLGDVVVGAGLQPDDEVVGVGLGRYDDDRHDALGPHQPAHVEAGHVGKAQVEQHEVRLTLGEGVETGLSIGGFTHFVPLVLQRQTQREADRIVIFYEQQRLHRPLILLQESHTSGLDSSQTQTIMTDVHAASVGYLPPPGASPAARNKWGFRVRMPDRRSPKCSLRCCAHELIGLSAR